MAATVAALALAASRTPLLVILATVTVTCLFFLPVSSVAALSPKNTTEFIRRSCHTTLYPSLCYSSLSRYADSVVRDPTHLALAAANVTLASVRAVHSYVSTLRRALTNRTVDAPTAAALRDCVENLDDAADLTKQAAAELWSLPTAEGNEVSWKVSNAQTWMSAAMTYEDTCTDAFEESADPQSGMIGGAPEAAGTWSVKEAVRRRVELAEQYTSNALALVNCLVN